MPTLVTGADESSRADEKTVCRPACSVPSMPTLEHVRTFWFCLAKLQASEYQSHRWTVYLRSPSGEDLQHVIKKVGEAMACCAAAAGLPSCAATICLVQGPAPTVRGMGCGCT